MKIPLTLAIVLLSVTGWAQKHLAKADNTKPFIKTTEVDTSLWLNAHSIRTWKPIKFIFFGVPDEVMSISAPDSNKVITVRFNKHLVHFINDSTFTYKQ